MIYADFLAAKRRAVQPAGVDVPAGELHPTLFPFQRHLVSWALEQGRCCLFADTGLGKTPMQIEWARRLGGLALVVAPLAVAQQTIRETARLLDVEVTYARHQGEVTGPLTITNYERLDRFDPALFDAVVLDESSILKSFSGKTRRLILDMFRSTRWRLACTATPAPNDEVELTNHAEFVGAMSRNDMLAAYFVHDDEGWRIKGHAAGPMYQWMATWAAALRRPSDLGYSDDGYQLPTLRIIPQIVGADVEAAGQLFPTSLGGVGGRAAVRQSTLEARVARALALAADSDDQWIVWCGLNAEARAVTADCPGAINVEGAMTPEQKTEALLAFQDGQIRVLVTKPGIAGFGMNFQNCHRMAFVGLSDSYEAYYQAIRRCWRFGQQRPVDAHVIVSDLEQEIVGNIQAKEAQAARMTDSLIAHVNRASLERAG